MEAAAPPPPPAPREAARQGFVQKNEGEPRKAKETAPPHTRIHLGSALQPQEDLGEGGGLQPPISIYTYSAWAQPCSPPPSPYVPIVPRLISETPGGDAAPPYPYIPIAPGLSPATPEGAGGVAAPPYPHVPPAPGRAGTGAHAAAGKGKLTKRRGAAARGGGALFCGARRGLTHCEAGGEHRAQDAAPGLGRGRGRMRPRG